jgi:hypothetical protein
MKKSILIPVLMLFINNCMAQEKTWESLKINNEIEILFPEKYVSTPVANNTVYRCKLADSTATLSFIELSLSNLGLTAEQMDEQATTEKFWSDYVPTMINQIPSAKLIEYKRKKVGNTPGAIITYKRGNNTLYQLVLVKELKNYIITFNSRDGKGDDKLKDAFFGKVKILK